MNLHYSAIKTLLPTCLTSVWLRAIPVAWCLSLAFSIGSLNAGAIYKTIDSNGNVIFTDQPIRGADPLNDEAVANDKRSAPNADAGQPAAAQADNADTPVEGDNNLPPSGSGVAVAPEPKNKPKSSYQEPNEPTQFLPVTVVEIITPYHDATLSHPVGKIWVELQSFPTPLTETGLTAQLWMDDKLINSGQRNMLSLPPPTRGTHVLRVKLVDDRGRLFLQSTPTHIHVR